MQPSSDDAGQGRFVDVVICSDKKNIGGKTLSLQFVFGNSGSGKSDYLYEYVLEQAAEHPKQNFLILVPEQYTMQTQRELVVRQKNHAIMNVEVLSFVRLAYRVFDELGRQDIVVLEETGKNLVLRKVAEQKKKELTTLGGNLNKMGYIGEVKSLISELAQYHVSPEDLEQFLSGTKIKEALRCKLADILVMYRGFLEYLKGRYITAEEVLLLLCELAEKSSLLRESVLVFDEFTGFTPVQNRLMRELLPLASKVMVSVTIDIREDFYHSRGIHELFAMSKKTVEVLQKLAFELAVAVEEPVVLSPGEEKRYRNAKELFFMEQNLFRPRCRRYEGEAKNIHIAELLDPRGELCFVAREITRLVREDGYCYKDIAVVTGDVPQYANYVPEIFVQYAIPHFIDQTRNIMFHPFIELIRAALEVVEYDFSYQSIFRFLRSGLAERICLRGAFGDEAHDRLTDTDIDMLENYVLAKGIRGRRHWSRPWTFVMRRRESEGEKERLQEELLLLNGIRESIWQSFLPLFEVFGKGHTVEEQTYALYQFLSGLECEQLLKEKEHAFEGENPVKAQEYAQIYRIVMDLLDKAASLLGDEEMTISEYGDILDAGFSAAKVGSIPPGNDRVTVGDIERTRLSHVKILFFVGVNDGIVPSPANTGGIISQFEREMMAEHRLKLAPGAREKVFIQKFYLYLNMTKPSDALYVTFSKVNASGKALRRSYLIGTLQQMFPSLVIAEQEGLSWTDDVLTPENALQFFLEGLAQERESGLGFEAERGHIRWGDEERELWRALAAWYLADESYREEIGRLFQAAAYRYTDDPIAKAVTRALYGTTLDNSVTRLERFAACAFAHYLNYGLHIRERDLQEFAQVDMGNIYHDALEHYARRLEASAYTWFDIPEEVRQTFADESMADAVAACEKAGVFEEAKNRYLLARMRATLQKTIWALTLQVQKGRFTPSAFEVGFQGTDDMHTIRFSLSEDEKMRLRGRIDRIDTLETEDKVYVKIVDYKSGNTTFSLLNLYHGLQLQLVVYLNAALELVARANPGRVAEPAGIFYYHIEDPMVEGSGTESEEEIRQAIFRELAPGGFVNEREEIYRAMDEDFSGSSAVIPVALKADGSLKAASKTASTEDFYAMSAHVNRMITDAGRRILAGDVSVAPYELADRTGCDYCPYHTVCGFDPRLPGFSYRRLAALGTAEELLEKMRNEEKEE